MRLLSLVLAVVLGASLLGSCLGGGTHHDLTARALEPGPSVAPDPRLHRFYDQHVTWRECRVTMQCAEVEVPLDYAHPSGRTIRLALLRVPATDPDQRVGALLVNPGGPGVPGIDYAARASTAFGDEIGAAYDVVGFDPRGVGESTPLRCASNRERDAVIGVDPDPETEAELSRAVGLIGRLGRDCLHADPGLTRHVSTEEQARDIDIIRAAALHQDRLAWYGASYGTYLGAWYAELFPDRVGRMVLDGAVDPDLDVVGTALGQARGFEGALRSYATECVARGDCYLGNSVDDATRRVHAFLDQLDQQPLRFGNRDLTEGLATQAIWSQLYLRQTWPMLDAGLEQALRGNASVLLTLVDQFLGRGPDGYIDNSIEMYYAISCLDHDRGPTDADVTALTPRFEKVSPTFGASFAAGTAACQQWPVHGGAPRALHAKGAAPIMVVGTTGDPATPYSWAEALAHQLDDAVLVRRAGQGHTGYNKGNTCVDDAVEKYLVSGDVPDATVDC